MEPEQADAYGALRRELTGYWQVLEPVFQWDARRRQNAGYAFLRDEVFPRRMAMLEIAGRIAHLNEEQLNRGEGRASQLLGRFQTRLGATLLAALCLGALMAAYSTREILRLEAQANARYQQAADARQQLTSSGERAPLFVAGTAR